MATKKIVDLTEGTTLASDDTLPFYDLSAAKTYKLTLNTLFSYIDGLFASIFAPIAKGVTNGDSHDHNGGDGAQIDHTILSNIGTNTHSIIDTFIASKGSANGIAPLNSASKVDPYVSTATDSTPGISELATLAEAITGTDSTRVNTTASARQAVISIIRDTFGKFPGFVPPSFNIFMGDSTADTTPTAPASGSFGRSTTGTRQGQTGLIETVAAAGLRRTWNDDGSLRGWLIEESRTNVVLYSRDLTNEVWVKTNCTAALTQTGIDGATSTASLLTATADGATCLQSASVTSSTRFQTAYLKRVTGTGVVSMTMDGTTWTDITSQLSSTAWTRISISSQTLATLSIGFKLATSGDAISVDGVQNEAGVFQTSVIFTTSASVARSSDSWYYVPSTSWFRRDKGSVFIKFKNGFSSSVSQTVFSFDNGGITNRISLVLTSIAFYILIYASGYTTIYNSIGIVPQDNTEYKISVSWNSSNIYVCINGGSVYSIPLYGLPSSPTYLRIGHTAGLNNFLNGYISQASYWPQTFTNAQLKSLTL